MNPEVFKQAQSRGWMEGWEYRSSVEIEEGLKYVFLKDMGVSNPKEIKVSTLSLNDIVFDPVIGTDFCEKYYGKYLYQTMMQRMLFLSEPERIAFLEKHLEVKEEKKCECKETSCAITCKKSHTHIFYSCERCREIITISPETIADLEFELKSCGACGRSFKKTEPELKEIQPLRKLKSDNPPTLALWSKVGELITQTNDNTKAISACKKDCKLNRG